MAEQRSGAGASAWGVADSAEEAAAVLERRAEFARRRADAFRQGAEGEAATATVLAQLSSRGWIVLHDRVAPTGGNIDHLVVGPGGVVVVDSKAWTGPIKITPRSELRVAGRNRGSAVASLEALTESIARVLNVNAGSTPVYSILALTLDGPEDGPARLGNGPLIAGVHDISQMILRLPQSLSPAQVDALVTSCLHAFPAASQEPTRAEAITRSESPKTSPLFERANMILFVEPWSRSGRRRLYLNDVEGKTLGYKDLVSGELVVEASEHQKLVTGVLKHAHSGGLSLSRKVLPKIPVRLPGGRLLGHLGRIWTDFLVVQHWRSGGKDRLYVTHAVRDHGIFELGHIDLKTGTLHPSSPEPLAKDLAPPARYLGRVFDRYPRRELKQF